MLFSLPYYFLPILLGELHRLVYVTRLPTFLVTATAKTQLGSLRMRFRPNPSLAPT
jgi:hypothetical protein